MTVVPPTSFARTVTLNPDPAVTVTGALTSNSDTTPTATVIPLEVPVIAPVTVSVAVTVRAGGEAVISVTPKMPVPLVRVVSAGRTAALSLEVKCTVPA